MAEKLSHFHDGRWAADSAEATEVEEHLAVCPHCAEVLEDYRIISEVAKCLRDADATCRDGAHFRRCVRRALNRRALRRRLGWAGAGLAAAAAAMIAVVLALPGPSGAERPTAGMAAESGRPAAVEESAAVVPVPPLPGPDEIMRRIEAAWNRSHALTPRGGIVPVGEGARVVPRERDGGAAPRHPLLGVYVSVPEGPPAGGCDLVVDRVLAGSPAQLAGLLPGDVILAIDGERLAPRCVERLLDLVRRAGPGARISIRYRRGGEVLETEAVLAGRD
jgi:hypothetical protein